MIGCYLATLPLPQRIPVISFGVTAALGSTHVLPPAQYRTLRLSVQISMEAAEWQVEVLRTKGSGFIRPSVPLPV